MLKFARLDDAFLEVFEPQASPVEGQSLPQKEKKRRKKEGKKKFQKSKSLKPKSQNVVKRDAGGKKGKLLCCKHIFDQIKANLAEIQLKKHQMSKKHIFAKSSRSQWVNGQYWVFNPFTPKSDYRFYSV